MSQGIVHIAFHGLPASPAMTRAIGEEADRLGSRFPFLVACRVVVDKPHRHHRNGNAFTVHLELQAPGHAFIVDHEHDLDAQAALHGAFRRAERQLLAHAGAGTARRRQHSLRGRDAAQEQEAAP
jgi:ribosome-associated translation inhibitor RaiA